MVIRKSLRLVVAIGGAVIASQVALAAETAPPAPAAPTQEQRQQMAEAHRKMADCLLSERAFAECRAEMHASCQAHMGPDGCAMMGGGMGMRHGPMGGMRPGPGMQQDAPPPQPPAE